MDINRNPNKRDRNYIPDNEIDLEEKASRRERKKGSVFNVIFAGIVVIALIAFVLFTAVWETCISRFVL